MKTENFSFEICTNEAQYHEYLHLRYAVFCEELKRVEWSGKSVAGRAVEEDKYDAKSLHIVARHLSSGAISACCRLILPSELGLSVLTRYQVDIPKDLSLDKVLEIGRTAIAPQFRRRVSDDKNLVIGDINNGLSPQDADKFRKYPSELVFGLYSVIYSSALERGITHALAAMDKLYSRNLTIAGLDFTPLSEENINIEPIRRVYIIESSTIPNALEKIKQKVVKI